jgi:hypothetical protein
VATNYFLKDSGEFFFPQSDLHLPHPTHFQIHVRSPDDTPDSEDSKYHVENTDKLSFNAVKVSRENEEAELWILGGY